MKVKQACRRDGPGGEPQCKGCAPANRGQKESSVCFSSISIAKLSISFELCKACSVFLSVCLLISIFPRAEPEYVCSPSAQGEGGELQWREDGATKWDWREKRGAVRRKRGTKQKYSRRPIHFFPTVFVPLLSEHVLRPSRIDAMRAYRLRAHSRVSRFLFFTFTPSPECHIVL